MFEYPHFATVMALLFVAQFIDRGLALLIPLQVAHLPGIEKIAAISGAIVSIGAIAATTSANVAARLAREVPAARILLIGLLIGGPLCAAMALPRGWPMLLVLRLLTGLCLGAAITLTYSLGAAIVPAETRRSLAKQPGLTDAATINTLSATIDFGKGMDAALIADVATPDAARSLATKVTESLPRAPSTSGTPTIPWL